MPQIGAVGARVLEQTLFPTPVPRRGEQADEKPGIHSRAAAISPSPGASQAEVGRQVKEEGGRVRRGTLSSPPSLI